MVKDQSSLLLGSIAILASSFVFASTMQEDRNFAIRQHGLAVSETGDAWVAVLPPVGLEGWNLVGGSALIERDGEELHGYRASGRNSFLLSDRQYGDFILEGEIKIKPGGNSGWQVRSHQKNPGDRRSTVRGYQIEVDTSDRSWSGGLYDEGRRAWIHRLEDDENARSAFKVEEWNHYRIELDGGHVRSWVNGVPCADALDFADLSGSIAFQVHSGNCDVRWRQLRIVDLGTSKFTDVEHWQPAGPNLSASRLAFTTQPDHTIKGQASSVPVSVVVPIPGPSCTVRLSYQLHGQALIQILSDDNSSEGFTITLDEEDPERNGSLEGLQATDSKYPVVTPGAGLIRSSRKVRDLLIDIEGQRLTVLQDGQVLRRVYADKPIQADAIKIELPPGESVIHLSNASVLERVMPTFHN